MSYVYMYVNHTMVLLILKYEIEKHVLVRHVFKINILLVIKPQD